MKKAIYLSFVVILILMGCSKSDDLAVNPNENQFKSARTVTSISTNPLQYWDNNDVLRTSLWYPPKSYTAPTGYPPYIASDYDLMAHFGYISPEDVKGAVVEFTFPKIKYFVPHITTFSENRTYTVNNVDNATVITCTTDLIKGMNPMFCFLVKVDCGKGNSGLANIWTDMKVNGVSVKGTIKNKVFACE
jgi:hypothetical protein